MPVLDKLKFVDNPAARNRPDHYTEITISIPRVMASWRSSLYSFEWLLPDGRVKSQAELPENEQPKRRLVEEKIKSGEALEKPVLGIGLLENVEIGSGRATLLTLAALEIETIPVHIPKSSEDEFAEFLA